MKRENLVLFLSSMMALVGLVTGGAGLMLVIKNFGMEYELEELRGSMKEVVVVKRPMEVGSKLSREDVELRVMPLRYMPPNPVFEKDLEIYLGMPISQRLRGDELLLTSDFSTLGEQARVCECAEVGARVRERQREARIKVVERARDE